MSPKVKVIAAVVGAIGVAELVFRQLRTERWLLEIAEQTDFHRIAFEVFGESLDDLEERTATE